MESARSRSVKLKDKFAKYNGGKMSRFEKISIDTRGEKAVDLVNMLHNKAYASAGKNKDDYELIPKTEATKQLGSFKKKVNKFFSKEAGVPFTIAPNRSSKRSISNGMNVVKQPTKISPMPSMDTKPMTKVSYLQNALAGGAIGSLVGGTASAIQNKDNNRLKSFGRGALYGGTLGAGAGLISKSVRVDKANFKKRVDDANERMDDAFRNYRKAKSEGPNHSFNFRQSYTRPNSQRRAKFVDPNAPEPIGVHLKNLSMNQGKFTTKAQVKEHHRSLLRKAHPDMGGSTAASAKINNALDELKKTDWFTKLSFLNTGGVSATELLRQRNL